MSEKILIRLGVAGLSLAAALVVLGVCYNKASAQEIPDFPPGDDQITALGVNDRAPFAGQLFSTDTAIRWGFRLQALRLRLDVEVDRARSLCVADMELVQRKLELEQERSAFQLKLLQEAVDASQRTIEDLSTRLAEGTPWYETWGFGFGMGVLAAAILTGLTAWVLTSLD